MLSIFNLDSHKFSNEHSILIKDWVIKRIAKKRIKQSLKDELILDLVQILTSEPKELIKLSKKYNSLFPKKRKVIKGKSKLVTDSRISYIFNYSDFRKNFGFILTSKLDISCCPYCNRNYITYHETLKENGVDKKYVFSEFDHFYPKTEHPFLALSFYNLIPSCNVCNTHYKGSKDPISRKIFHPYTKVKINHFNFKFFPEDYLSLIGKGLSIKLDFEFNETPTINRTVKSSIDFFDIKNIYEKNHSGLIKDIIDKKITYNRKYLTELQSIYGLSFEESYKVLFETHYDEKLLTKRPFSKLKRDIFDDLKIV